MKRYSCFYCIATLTLFFQSSGGLRDTIITPLQKLAAGLSALSKELSASSKLDTFKIPKFEKSAVVALGKPKDFSGISVTQLTVFDQNAQNDQTKDIGAGAASCGYQALKNVVVLMKGIISGQPAEEISEQLQNPFLANRLFGTQKTRAALNAEAGNGAWRQITIDRRINTLIEKAIPLFFSAKRIVKMGSELPDSVVPPEINPGDYEKWKNDFAAFMSESVSSWTREIKILAEHAFKEFKSSGGTPVWEYTLMRGGVFAGIYNGLENLWRFRKDRTYRGRSLEDLIRWGNNFERFKETIALAETITVAVDFRDPQKMCDLFSDARRQAMADTFRLEEIQKNPKNRALWPDTALKNGEIIKKYYTNNFDLYTSVSQSIEPIDCTGDWLTDGELEKLIPEARGFAALGEKFPLFVIQDPTIIPDIINPLEEITAYLQTSKTAPNTLLGIVLGGQNQEGTGPKHWLGLVFVRKGTEQHLFILDSLSNANRIEPIETELTKELGLFSDVDFETFNQRIRDIAKTITQAMSSKPA
jgi:hypothetical protein